MEMQLTQIYGMKKKHCLREKFIVLNAYIRKGERSKVGKFPPQETRKKKNKLNPCKQKRKMRAEINGIENRILIQKINETESWFLIIYQSYPFITIQ